LIALIAGQSSDIWLITLIASQGSHLWLIVLTAGWVINLCLFVRIVREKSKGWSTLSWHFCFKRYILYNTKDSLYSYK
jgi:hypothetical protein